MRSVGDRISTLDEELRAIEVQLTDILAMIPNIPDARTPYGQDEHENVVLRTVGQLPEFDFEPQAHWDLGPELGIIDFEQGVKITGSRFYVLSGAGARLQRALIAWMLDLHIRQGYTEKYPPFMVKGATLFGSGQLPKFADNLYHDHEEDLWMVPTAEVPLTGIHMDELSRTSRSAASLYRLHALLPAREDERRARRARHQARPPVRQGRDVHVYCARTIAGSTGEDACRCRRDLQAAGFHLTASCSCAPATWVLMRSITYDIEVWAAGLRRMAGGFVGLECDGFPGPPRQYPLPARWTAGVSATCTP